MSHISYAGIPVTDISLSIPYVGLWTADAKLALATPAPSTGPLVFGNMTLLGSTFRASTFGGVTSARLVGGFGGWSKQVGPRGYSLPFGISLSLVLSDVALEVQELVSVVADRQIGTTWARPPGPVSAGAVLRYVAGSSWWVNASGVVQVGPRLPSIVSSPWQAIEWNGASGILTIATEDQASWQPGATFVSPFVTSTQTVAFVRHSSDNAGNARMRVMVK